MARGKSKVTVDGKEWTILTIENGNGSIEIIPEAGLSLTSFKWKGKELLDTWELAKFLGTEADIEFISKNTTDIFRKGFGPSIGPWFGPMVEGGKEWQHGVCRFADWKNVNVTENSITGKLDGSTAKLLGRTLNDICGFKLDVEISYTLSESGLEYKIKNNSEESKGTYGIHWYWKNPAGTKIRLQTPEKTILAEMNEKVNGRNFSAKGGTNESKGEIIYSDGSSIEFFYDDIFEYTVLFNVKNALCFEPVSGKSGCVGQFTEGKIQISPKNFK